MDVVIVCLVGIISEVSLIFKLFVIRALVEGVSLTLLAFLVESPTAPTVMTIFKQ